MSNYYVEINSPYQKDSYHQYGRIQDTYHVEYKVVKQCYEVIENKVSAQDLPTRIKAASGPIKHD